jgi:4-amino-4-deoxy-L-arabinose transferase
MSQGTGERPAFWLVLLLVVMAFTFQGSRGLWEPDEGRYSSAGINMLETGNWLLPTLDRHHPHLTKPPMTYWVLAASFGLLGNNEWAARLPGALAFIGTGLLVFGLGRRLLPERPWLPALIWSLSLAAVIGANIVSTDNLLAFFETAAMFCFVEWWTRPGSVSRGWIRGMWLLWGLAFMTKGPPALLPLLAVVVYLAVHDRQRLRPLFDPLGLLTFLIVGLSWYVAIIVQQPDRLRYFLGYEVYDRVFTAVHDRNAQWYGAFAVYLPVLLVGMLPWSIMAVMAAGGLRRGWQSLRTGLRYGDRTLLLLLYWLLVPLTTFFLARSRLQLYILPLFVPLALLAARPLSRWSWLTARRLTATALFTGVALLVIKGGLAHRSFDRDSKEMAHALSAIVDTDALDEIVFVGMIPFYGLNVYLKPVVAGVHLSEARKLEYSRFIAASALCEELRREQSVIYVMKPRAERQFVEEAGKCAASAPQLLGSFSADGKRLTVFRSINTKADRR